MNIGSDKTRPVTSIALPTMPTVAPLVRAEGSPSAWGGSGGRSQPAAGSAGAFGDCDAGRERPREARRTSATTPRIAE